MTTRVTAGLVLLLLGAGAMVLSQTASRLQRDDAPTALVAEAPAKRAAAFALPADTDTSNTPRYRGIAIQIHTNYRVLETFAPLIAEVADTGANTLLLTTAAWMEHAKSQGIYVEHRRTPSREELMQLIRIGRDAGLDVFVMPIVLLAHPRGREWRGVIEPPDWDLWWEDYREFIVYFADLSREAGAHGFVIGSELVKTESQTAEWVRTIEFVRARFPEAVLGYSANWDTYHKVQFWDKLDFVGMTSYFKLAEHEHPTVDEMTATWLPIQAEIVAWRAKIGLPLVLTEVGWCSQEGAAITPWNYFRNQRATPAGLEEQRRLYQAFVEVWGASPGLAGVFWWEWKADAGGAGDFGYTPKGKPAERVLREWFAACARVSAGDQPSTRPGEP